MDEEKDWRCNFLLMQRLWNIFASVAVSRVVKIKTGMLQTKPSIEEYTKDQEILMQMNVYLKEKGVKRVSGFGCRL